MGGTAPSWWRRRRAQDIPPDPMRPAAPTPDSMTRPPDHGGSLAGPAEKARGKTWWIFRFTRKW